MSPTANIPTSPSSTSSYDILSSVSRCSFGRAAGISADSDDEILWPQGLSTSDPSSESSIVSDSDDDDFVVLSRPRSPSSPRVIHRTVSAVSDTSSTDDDLSSALSGLSLRRRPGSASVQDAGEPIPRPLLRATITNALRAQPPPADIPSKKKKKEKKKEKVKKATKKAAKGTRAGAAAVTPKFPVTNDAASDTSEGSAISAVSGYDEAVTFITSFLSSPEARDSVCKLTLLHSLILELGLRTAGSTSALPGSLTAAKALLKKQAHVNIREYIAVRQQGQAALQKVMHPSRNALIKSIRQKRNPASLKWVKSQGLQVLLVTCFR